MKYLLIIVGLCLLIEEDAHAQRKQPTHSAESDSTILIINTPVNNPEEISINLRGDTLMTPMPQHRYTIATPVNDVQKLLQYPQVALEKAIEGKVRVSALVRLGSVVSAEAIASDDARLNDAAIAAVKQLKFKVSRQAQEETRFDATEFFHIQIVNFRLPGY